MALPASGQISMADVNLELGQSSTAALSLNDAIVRSLFGVTTQLSQISLSNGWGKSNAPTYVLTASSTTISEDDGVTYSLHTFTTTGVAAGTTFYWEVVSVTGNVTATDFTIQLVSGTFTHGTGTVNVTSRIATADLANEGDESFYIRVRLGSSTGTIVATGPTVTISDTSRSTGQILYDTPGVYTFVRPPAFTSFGVVCVGGGGSGGTGDGGGGGAGGGLAWNNFINQTAASYTVSVGAGGAELVDSTITASTLRAGRAGADSYYSGTAICRGVAGGAPSTSLSTRATGGSYANTTTNSSSRGGGTGGYGGYFTTTDGTEPDAYANCGGGGGAGGYSGAGGYGGPSTSTAARSGLATAGAGGAGGGGGTTERYSAAGGGGVGVYGLGANGAAGVFATYSAGSDGGTNWGGGGGSGGQDGYWGYGPFSGYGGAYGGGSGGAEYHPSWTYAWAAAGGRGAVRIIWGSGRAFPSTSTGDM